VIAVIVILKFRTEAVFSDQRGFRQIMESFLLDQITLHQAGKLLGDTQEGVAIALAALYVLGRQKNSGAQLTIYEAPVTRQWFFFQRRQL
jgi:hypothetical protein